MSSSTLLGLYCKTKAQIQSILKVHMCVFTQLQPLIKYWETKFKRISQACMNSCLLRMYIENSLSPKLFQDGFHMCSTPNNSNDVFSTSLTFLVTSTQAINLNLLWLCIYLVYSVFMHLKRTSSVFYIFFIFKAQKNNCHAVDSRYEKIKQMHPIYQTYLLNMLRSAFYSDFY